MAEQEIGVVTHYFGHIKVAAIKLTSGELRVGDSIRIKGHTTDVTTPINSMQINHASVQIGKAGDAVGISVPEHVREHDKVYKIVPD
jgi:translation elongation factor EF-1alpha